MIVAVPRLGCALLLPYPPQPPRVRESPAIARIAEAVSNEARKPRRLTPRATTNPNIANAAKREPAPIRFTSRSPYRGTLADVVTVNMVLAAPLVGATVAGLKAQLIPVTGEQEKETLFANPPAGVTVSMNCADWPATTVALVGFSPKEKSGFAMLIVTAADVLLANVVSPA